MSTNSKSSMKGGSDQHRRAMDYFAKKLNNNATGSVRASQGMAALLLKDKQVERAMEHYASAAMDAPNDILVRNDYAIALSKTGNKSEGVEVLRSALQVTDPLTTSVTTIYIILRFEEKVYPIT